MQKMKQAALDQTGVKKTLRTADELHQAGFLTLEQKEAVQEMTKVYDIAVTPEMANAIDKNNAFDPIAAQFIPSAKELKILPEEMADPIGDYPHAPMKALVHRHENRVLIKPTNVCAIYCRFCLRREMIGPQGDTITQKDVEEALDYIEQHDEIYEVIFSGGDPLMLSPAKLGDMMRRLQAMPHIKWIRLHTRIPVVAPEKINAEMLDALKSIKPVILAIHTNHAREYTVGAASALARLAYQGITLLGQTVLLKGVNNNVPALKELFETMMQHRIKPYYLHHPDLTMGTSHFRLSLEEGIALVNAVRPLVSGVCMPEYTIDIPGGVSKMPISANFVRKHPELAGTYILTDPMGGEHLYREVL